ncbi:MULTISPECIES: hypothetical protein [Calothrix]|nr:MULTISPECIES: hypothetical protein [Calothrix]
MPNAQCPMPNAPCPMPHSKVTKSHYLTMTVGTVTATKNFLI